MGTRWYAVHLAQCVSRGLHAPFEKTHAVQQVVSRTTAGRRRAALRHRNNQGVQRGRARCPTSRPSRKGCSSSFMTSIKPWRCGLVVAQMVPWDHLANLGIYPQLRGQVPRLSQTATFPPDSCARSCSGDHLSSSQHRTFGHAKPSSSYGRAPLRRPVRKTWVFQ
jgi:hypothetical protein